MAKWNAGVGLQLTIDYDDIEADTEAEAIQIAKERALEDIEWNNCDCDASNPIVYYCQQKWFGRFWTGEKMQREEL